MTNKTKRAGDFKTAVDTSSDRQHSSETTKKRRGGGASEDITDITGPAPAYTRGRGEVFVTYVWHVPLTESSVLFLR